MELWVFVSPSADSDTDFWWSALVDQVSVKLWVFVLVLQMSETVRFGGLLHVEFL